ncbi:MAG: NUDIX domain-containing protein [Patescibacteria group bacterium]
MIINTARVVDRVAGVVLKEDSVLLMYRKNYGKEYYTFPGGGIDYGETKEGAFIREMAEETSLNVKPEKILYEVNWDNGTKQYFFQVTCLIGEPVLGDFDERKIMQKDPEQYYEPKWVQIADLPKLLIFPLEVVDLLISDLKTGLPAIARQLSITFATSRQER